MKSLVGALIISIFALAGITQNVEVKNNYFYIDGQKFFIKGIGYEAGALPRQLPWNKTYNPGQLQFDIQRILSAGYNTIRTWAPFSAQELDYLDNFNIKIIMGIWIDPAGNFSDPTFIANAKATVSNVLSYSKNHNNIIAYLIVNEPLPETIFAAGINNTVGLWTELINMIHAQHPNRPVSIANTSNGTYIDAKIFDFSAYNVYIYNPVTVNFLHGYRDFTKYLQQLNVPGHPLIITEYGLSVSPSGPGNWGYGGNSFTEQKEGILHMYKSLVDGGASGSCVFNYSDGWWKAGNEFVHDDAPEEWFGLVGYSNLNDTHGEERPVWKAVKDYQSAIITQPSSSEIYSNNVPLEIFFNDSISRIDILLDNSLFYQKQLINTYLADTLRFNNLHMKDAILVFNCYDKADSLIKSEEKNILITDHTVTLPTIQITTNSDFWQTGSVYVNYMINKSPDFTTDPELDYIFYPHVGFNYGQKYQAAMSADPQLNISGTFYMDNSVNVFTLGAAFNVSYNSFHKRIVNQATFSRYTNSYGVDEIISSPLQVQISPNPASKCFNVLCNESIRTSSFDYAIFNNTGILIKNGQKKKWNQSIEISDLNPGAYIIRINIDGLSLPVIKKLIIL